jgi:hypothetical protein
MDREAPAAGMGSVADGSALGVRWAMAHPAAAGWTDPAEAADGPAPAGPARDGPAPAGQAGARAAQVGRAQVGRDRVGPVRVRRARFGRVQVRRAPVRRALDGSVPGSSARGDPGRWVRPVRSPTPRTSRRCRQHRGTRRPAAQPWQRAVQRLRQAVRRQPGAAQKRRWSPPGRRRCRWVRRCRRSWTARSARCRPAGRRHRAAAHPARRPGQR